MKSTGDRMIRKRIHDWKDLVYLSIDAVEAGINDLIMQDPDQAAMLADCCWVCKSRQCLEMHHLAGRKHDPRTVTVCHRCHQILSRWQYVWDKRWLLPGLSDDLRLAFYLLGVRDLLRLKAEVTGNLNYRLLADLYIDEISKLMEETNDE